MFSLRWPAGVLLAALVCLAVVVSRDAGGAGAQPASQETVGNPAQWSPDKKVASAIERLQELKEAAQQFSRRECPKTKADFDSWLNEGLDLAGSLTGLQDSTRQIRRTGAGAERLRAWDTARSNGGPGGLPGLVDLLGRCGRSVTESDASFKPPSQESVLTRATQRIAEKKKSELASFGIPLEEKDEFKVEGSAPRSIR